MRMNISDEGDVIMKGADLMDMAKAANQSFFVWFDTNRPHLHTQLRDAHRCAAAEVHSSDDDCHGSGIQQHDHDVGLLLDRLDRQGLGRLQGRASFDIVPIVVEQSTNKPRH